MMGNLLEQVDSLLDQIDSLLDQRLVFIIGEDCIPRLYLRDDVTRDMAILLFEMMAKHLRESDDGAEQESGSGPEDSGSPGHVL